MSARRVLAFESKPIGKTLQSSVLPDRESPRFGVMEQVIWHAGHGRRRPVWVQHAECLFLNGEARAKFPANSGVEPAFGPALLDDVCKSFLDFRQMPSEPKVARLAGLVVHQFLILGQGLGIINFIEACRVPGWPTPRHGKFQVRYRGAGRNGGP